MNRTLGIITLLALLGTARADTLYFRNGPKVDGVFIGATSQQVKFKGPDGAVTGYPISNIEAVEFSVPPPKPKPAGSNVVIPASTIITATPIANIDSAHTSSRQN